jgi:hypothetical protein
MPLPDMQKSSGRCTTIHDVVVTVVVNGNCPEVDNSQGNGASQLATFGQLRQLAKSGQKTYWQNCQERDLSNIRKVFLKLGILCSGTDA